MELLYYLRRECKHLEETSPSEDEVKKLATDLHFRFDYLLWEECYEIAKIWMGYNPMKIKYKENIGFL